MKKSSVTTRLVSRASISVVMAVIVLAGLVVPVVRADKFDDQIRALNDANAEAGTSVNSLQSQADSYQGAIDQFQAQINSIQAQIAANQAQQAKLQLEIIDKQAQLDQQRALLGDDIKAMYVDGQMTAIEMLATSKNLSEYVDKEEYRNTVQKKIQESLARIAKLQSELKVQKTQVDELLESQKTQQAQLAANRAEQANMLAYTQAQKDQFSQQIAANSSKIKDLKEQQRLSNMRNSRNISYGGSGGYPWASQPHNPAAWFCGGPDPWGMCYRECVSYTAWKVASTGRYMPYWGGSGNAYQWIANAQSAASRQAGIVIDRSPEPGDIAIRDRNNSYDVGHAMYVESVLGSGEVVVSQYNANLTGEYSTATKSAGSLYFITFPPQ